MGVSQGSHLKSAFLLAYLWNITFCLPEGESYVQALPSYLNAWHANVY